MNNTEMTQKETSGSVALGLDLNRSEVKAQGLWWVVFNSLEKVNIHQPNKSSREN